MYIHTYAVSSAAVRRGGGRETHLKPLSGESERQSERHDEAPCTSHRTPIVRT